MPSFKVHYYLVGKALTGVADVIVTEEAESIDRAREFVIEAHNDPERTFYFWSQGEVIICVPKANVLAFLLQQVPSDNASGADNTVDPLDAVGAAGAPDPPYPLISDDEPDPFALPSS